MYILNTNGDTLGDGIKMWLHILIESSVMHNTRPENTYTTFLLNLADILCH